MNTKKNKPKTSGRRRGAQQGNLNALKHGFYASALTRAQQIAFDQAQKLPLTDLSQELALLRARIHSLLTIEPANLQLLLDAINTLARLALTQTRLRAGSDQELSDAIHQILHETIGPQLLPDIEQPQ